MSTLRAVYTSPDPSLQTKSFTHDVSSPVASSQTTPSRETLKAKTAHLSELRQLVPKLQDEVNVFLTERMEGDKKAAQAQGQKQSEKEAKEEENYGEENVEDI